MSGIMSASALGALFDSSKGSLTNRIDCAKEHLKNTAKYVVPVGVTAGGIFAASKIKPLGKAVTKTGTFLGKGLSKVLSKLGPKIANSSLVKTIAKNPTKIGLAGMAIALGVWLYGKTTNYIYKSGQIDQKYTDAAKIEEQTKNVILANKQMNEVAVA